MKTGDAVTLIRKRPRIFLPSAHPTPEDLAQLILEDARTNGAVDARVADIQRLLVVHATVDWLDGEDIEVLFRVLIPSTGPASHTVRPYLYLTAFGRLVATQTLGHNARVISGRLGVNQQRELSSLLERGSKRLVAFAPRIKPSGHLS